MTENRSREGYGSGVAGACHLFNVGTPWVGETENLRDLVKGLSGGVIAGTTQQAILPGSLRVVQVCMSSRSHQGHIGALEMRMVEQASGQMPLNVVDGHQGFSKGVRERLGCGHPHEERTHQAGTDRDGEASKITKVYPGLLDR